MDRRHCRRPNRYSFQIRSLREWREPGVDSVLFSWTFDTSVVDLIMALHGWTGLVAIGTLIAIAGVSAFVVAGDHSWRRRRD
jgi:hypothetical protein